MTLKFSVLFEEPLTAKEVVMVKRGVRFNPHPVLLRWAKRKPVKNKVENVVHVVAPTKL